MKVGVDLVCVGAWIAFLAFVFFLVLKKEHGLKVADKLTHLIQAPSNSCGRAQLLANLSRYARANTSLLWLLGNSCVLATC